MVIAIIAILVLLLLPAINAAREAARRNGCMSRLGQLGVALSNYHMGHEVFPPGTVDAAGPVANRRAGYHHSWLVKLLPYVEEQTTYSHVDKSKSVYHPNNTPVAKVVNVALFRCPSSWVDTHNTSGEAMSDYAACHHDVEGPIDADNNGVMYLNSAIRQRDVTDGLTKTIFVGEKISDPGSDMSWLSGTRGTLRNTGTPINMTGTNAPGAWSPLPEPPEYDPYSYDDQPPPDDDTQGDDEEPNEEDTEEEEDVSGALYVGGFGSFHITGALFLFGDGHVRMLPDSIDPNVYQQLGHRADGKLLGSLDDL